MIMLFVQMLIQRIASRLGPNATISIGSLAQLAVLGLLAIPQSQQSLGLFLPLGTLAAIFMVWMLTSSRCSPQADAACARCDDITPRTPLIKFP